MFVHVCQHMLYLYVIYKTDALYFEYVWQVKHYDYNELFVSYQLIQ